MQNTGALIVTMLRLGAPLVHLWRICDYDRQAASAGPPSRSVHWCGQHYDRAGGGIKYLTRCSNMREPAQTRAIELAIDTKIEREEFCAECARDYMHCVGADDPYEAAKRMLSAKQLCETEYCSRQATHWGGIAGSSATIELCEFHYNDLEDEGCFYMGGNT